MSVAVGTPLAIGWATVELDRAAAELAPLLVEGGTFVRAQASIHLGGYARIGRVDPGRVPPDALAQAAWVVLLEPSTEGILAGTLARHGEGWCATWTTAAGGGLGAAPPRSLLRPGPLGDERLLLDGPRWGPHRLVVEVVTIRP